jgi:hypothetical protein
MNQSPLEYTGVGYPNAILITKNQNVADENCYQYEFRNLSNCVVQINGLPLLPSHAEGSIPGVVKNVVSNGALAIWAPLMKAGERDTTSYQIFFDDSTVEGNVSPIHRLYVLKKQIVPIPANRNRR